MGVNFGVRSISEFVLDKTAKAQIMSSDDVVNRTLRNNQSKRKAIDPKSLRIYNRKYAKYCQKTAMK